jgi:hypothetical protein
MHVIHSLHITEVHRLAAAHLRPVFRRDILLASSVLGATASALQSDGSITTSPSTATQQVLQPMSRPAFIRLNGLASPRPAI